MSTGVVTVGHHHPGIFGRTIISLLANTESFDEKTYYIGLNSPEGTLEDDIKELCDSIRKELPIDINVIKFTENKGLFGFSRCIYEIIKDSKHDHYIQLASDVFSVSRGIDDRLLETHKRLSHDYDVGFVAPFTNINEYCAPYFVSKFFKGTDLFELSVKAGTQYNPSCHPVYTQEWQSWIWENTEDLIWQESKIKQGIISKKGAPCTFSCSVILFSRETFDSFGEGYYNDGGEEPAFYRKYGHIENGIVVDSDLYAAHFSYCSGYRFIHVIGTDFHIFDVVDKMIKKRIEDSPFKSEINKIICNTRIGKMINV